MARLVGRDNPNWKGGRGNTGRERARRLYASGPCAICGAELAMDLHHRNGDSFDNSPENVQRLCRSCHVKKHPRARQSTRRVNPVQSQGKDKPKARRNPDLARRIQRLKESVLGEAEKNH